MKLLGLHIEKLYGHYNYDRITFNSDVTFIYGLNGCGKTTVLNIIEAIITGQIYKLFNYDFYKIELKYASKNNGDKIHKINIERNENTIKIIFENKEYKIEKKREYIRDLRNFDREYTYYFDKYKFLSDIKKTFNYVYLPLNRTFSINDYESEDIRYIYQRKYFFNKIEGRDVEDISRDLSITQIERLIEESCTKINSEISKINDKFRNNILKSLLDVNEQNLDLEKLKEEMLMQAINNSIEDTKEEYIKILKDLSLINEDEEKHFTEFFDGIGEDVDNINNIERGNLFSTLLKINEVIKIKKIVSLARDTEEKKNNVRKPIEKFIHTMNEFINSGEDEKQLNIDQMGQVYFTTRYNKKGITIQDLSSGEKQLLTFFANLIFKVGDDTSGIFVVDEPELSLHLSWQKKFVEKTLEINGNIQLIFATHAPEIIGKNRGKMFKLEKKYVI